MKDENDQYIEEMHEWLTQMRIGFEALEIEITQQKDELDFHRKMFDALTPNFDSLKRQKHIRVERIMTGLQEYKKWLAKHDKRDPELALFEQKLEEFIQKKYPDGV
jgi:uncharacterized short protein YbdD (DUF466 family)